MHNCAITSYWFKCIFLAIFLLGHTVAVNAQSASWLVGKWELTSDPDGSHKDFLEFSADGKVSSISSSGQQTLGVYAIDHGVIKVTFVLANGRPYALQFSPSEDHLKLKLKSQKTGNVAVYEKNAP